MRDLFLLPALVGWMLWLGLAAWPSEIRPALLDGASTFAYETLESVGLRAGIPVFAGTLEKQPTIVRSRCIFARGTDLAGNEVELYPREPCPKKGFRWGPVVYDHMLLHWVRRLGKDGSGANLAALEDHFCRVSPVPLERVEITYVVTFMEYATGREQRRTFPVGKTKCRS